MRNKSNRINIPMKVRMPTSVLLKRAIILVALISSASPLHARSVCPALSVTSQTAWDRADGACIRASVAKIRSELSRKYASKVAGATSGQSATEKQDAQQAWNKMRDAQINYIDALCTVKNSDFDLNPPSLERATSVCVIVETAKHIRFLDSL